MKTKRLSQHFANGLKAHFKNVLRWTFVASIVLGSIAFADDLSTKAGVQRAERRIRTLPRGPERDQQSFNVGLALGALDEPMRGLSYLSEIEPKNAAGIGKDVIDLNMARLYFQLDDLEHALAFYDKISKGSDYWLTAQEEKAHSYGRQKKYDKVISTLTTVVSPVFDGLVGPEPYFVLALTQLKICDYSDIFRTTGQFKVRIKPHVKAIQDLIRDGNSEHITKALARLQRADFDWKAADAEAKFLPHTFFHDPVISQRLVSLKAAVASKNSAQSDALIGLIRNRTVDLARLELKEIKNTAQELNIIEAEVIERMHAFDKKKGRRPVQGELTKSSADTLVFPIDKSGEIWLDELGNYQAQVKGCPDINWSQGIKRRL
jgi:hypothetical protein